MSHIDFGELNEIEFDFELDECEWCGELVETLTPLTKTYDECVDFQHPKYVTDTLLLCDVCYDYHS